MKRSTGQIVRIGSGNEAFQAFVPDPLPPEPPLKLTTADQALLEKASRALGKLDGMTSLLPNTSLFIYAYVRKEALVSSQIEGTQSSLSDLLLYESDYIHFNPVKPGWVPCVAEWPHWSFHRFVRLGCITRNGRPRWILGNGDLE